METGQTIRSLPEKHLAPVPKTRLLIKLPTMTSQYLTQSTQLDYYTKFKVVPQVIYQKFV